MYLGLDIGTSSVKAVLIDGDQRLVATASSPLSLSRPHDGWSEQDPDDWIKAVNDVLLQIQRDKGEELRAVRGIGLSGQMHGATLLDEADRPLRPCILWNDGRSAREAAELDSRPEFREITGNIVFPGFTAPKIVWAARNEPELFERVRRVLLPKDYVRLWLSGDAVSDMSDAAGTAWLDTSARMWSPQLLEFTGLQRQHMPALVEGSAPSATLRPSLAACFGMGPGVVIAGGAGDNAASACGVGAVTPGTGFISLGTSGVLFAVTDTFRPNPASAVHAFCHALPDTWHQMGVILSATASLEWLAGVTGRSASDLTTMLGASPRAPAAVRFLPYLSGERTPHNDAAIRGAFDGIGHESDAAALTQAVLEGVAFAFADCQDAMQGDQPEPPFGRLIAVGGGSRSRYWLSLLATVLRIPIDVPQEGDFGAAFGAARLGLIAATDADPRAVCTVPPIRETIDPEPQLMAAFTEAHAAWKGLYPAVKQAAPGRVAT